MLDRLRNKAYGVLTSDRGDGNPLVRAARRAALRANDGLGRPLASPEELAERAAYERPGASSGSEGREQREAAPVMVFFTEKQHSTVKRIRDVFVAAGIPFTEQNIEGDLPAIEATLRDGNGFKLPLVFIGGECIGGFQQLLNMHNNGKLTALVYGA